MNSKNPLVSVVVPIYNVEDYVAQCVASVTGQTYDNLEIILVNDGSKDESATIIDKFAKRDERIRVIYKNNGGLSDARNVGLAKAAGCYVLLIDGDDFIDKDYVRRLVDTAIKTRSDIVASSWSKYYDNSSGSRSVLPECKEGNVLVYNKFQAMQRMLYMDKVTNSAWGKLYRRELFDGIKYPVGHNYEDLATTYLLFDAAGSVAFLDYPGYYYRQNLTGIIRASFRSDRMDGLMYAKEELSYLASKYREDKRLRKAATYRYFLEAILIGLSITKIDVKEDNKVYYNECMKIVNTYKWAYLFDFNQIAKWHAKNALLCFLGNKVSFKIISRMTR